VVPEDALGVTPLWRRIDELAELVGAYCWVEHRIFELTGAWATGPRAAEDPSVGGELRVWCAAASRRHGALAGRWAERLPVRAGVDPAELVRAPEGPLAEALDAMAAEPNDVVRFGALVETVLPRVGGVYGAHAGSASPVSEGSVLEVLVEAQRELAAEIRGGRALLEGLAGASGQGREIRAAIERAFDATRVFPAVRTS
jgi:hypothetical protein